MANSKSNKKSSSLDIIGDDIGGLLCSSYFQLGDAVIIEDALGQQKIFTEKSIDKIPKPYKIDNSEVVKVSFSKDHSLYILQTVEKSYFRNKANQDIQGAEEWTDFYLEPHTSSFFRKDNRGRWYDIQGYMLKTSFLIKDQVLISLNGKTSKKSLFYRDQKLYINPKSTMAQVGKVAYDLHLNILNYFGEKITGLSHVNIQFSPSSSVQEVQLGLAKRAFIDDLTYAPLIINGEEIIRHISTKEVDKFRFEIFCSEENEYIVCNDLTNVLQYKNETLKANFDTYMTLGSYHVIMVENNDTKFYFDLKSGKPFDPLENGEHVVEIDPESINKDNSTLFNIICSQQKIVFNATKDEVFTMGDKITRPQSISISEDFDQHFYYAIFDGVSKLCSQKSNTIIQINDQSIEISKILSDSNQKLINILTTTNELFALDARFGFDQLSIANIGSFNIVEALDSPHLLGNLILQNVSIQTLGGTKNRVVNLNEPELDLFRLPKDLKTDSSQSATSIFADNLITKIDFEKTIDIEQNQYFSATFIDYLNDPKSIILQQKNAKPLQLDGVGHRNEIVQRFEASTISKSYYLSDHRIVGVHSLTEDLKENQLLFSCKTMSSWLPFYDTYLPIFKSIKDFENSNQWEYHLFELHNLSVDQEYVAVEQNPPYRILVDKSKSKYKPRIVKSKELILKSPEEISAIRRFFSNPGYLVEVG